MTRSSSSSSSSSSSRTAGKATAHRVEAGDPPEVGGPPKDDAPKAETANVMVARGDARVLLQPQRLRRVRSLRLWTLDGYILRSFLVSYVVCSFSFTGLYVAIEAFTKINRFIPSGELSPFRIAGTFLSNLFQYHLAMVPTIYVNYMGPILTLAGAMFALTFLNRGNEFTPIKAAGVSVYRVLLPLFLVAAGFTALSFYLQEHVIPELREPIRRALAVSRSGDLRPKPFYDPVHNLHITVHAYRPDLKVAEGVNIKKWNLVVAAPEAAADTAPATATTLGNDNVVLDAVRMVWVPSADSTPRRETGHWVLRDGSVQRWRPGWQGELVFAKGEGKEARVHLKETFEELALESSMLPIDLETSDQDISYLSWGELKSQFERQPYHRHLRTRLHQHFAFPLSHIILLLLGIPFVLNFGNTSFFLSLAASFFLCAGYFLLSSMAFSLASDPGGTPFSPIIAAWLPNILFGSLGLTIFTNMRT